MARLILNNDLVFRRSGEPQARVEERRVLGRGFIEGCRSIAWKIAKREGKDL